jgi:hypothetical protein
MTYTFKLARRLAVSRKLITLPVLLVFAACSGSDATAPEGSPAESPAGPEWSPDFTPVALRINPSGVTLETNQLIHFRAHGRTSAGDSVDAAVTWRATGGTILPDGRYSAAAVGTYAIIGRNRVRGGVHFDTSIVTVVRRQTMLASVELTPGSTSLAPGVSQTFTAVGRLASGQAVPIGVNWSATGGSIDAGGTYVAGDTAGTFQVIGMNTAGTVADTATVSITAPASPPPPPPDPSPAPVLVKVKLVPGAATLAAGASWQFTAYGQTAAGDSVAVGNVVFNAPGGTVNASGLYTAGYTAGKFRLIASSGALADTSIVTVNPPLGAGTPTGIPFGSWECEAPDNLGPFNLCIRSAGYWIAGELAELQPLKGKLMLSQGGYEKFKTNGIYDPAKYYAWVQTLKPYVAAWQPYLENGTLMGVQVIDDVGTMNWGGKAITKAQQDEMAKWWKQLVPGITTFTREKATGLTGHTWAYLDASITQYNARYMGDITKWRDSNVVAAKAAKLGLAFSLNVLNGGKIVAGCYHGEESAYCAMSPTELRTYGAVQAAAPDACGLVSWKTDAAYHAMPGVTDAFKYLAGLAAAHSAATCRVR